MFGYWCRTSTSSRARGSARDDLLGGAAHERDVLLEQLVVEVAHDRLDLRVAAEASTSVGWMKPSRPEVVSGVSRSDGRAARISPASRAALTSLPVAQPGWMSTPCTVSVTASARERLVLQLAGLRAVERVGARGAEALDVEPRRALADLLVGREADPQRRPRQLGVRGQVRDRGHDLGHAGLVVGAQQRVAARGHDVVARLAGQHRHVGRVEHACRRAGARSRRRRSRGARSARRPRRGRRGSCRCGPAGR